MRVADSTSRRLNALSITDTAIAIADAEGLESVSMRRVGASLGVSAMALYRHIPDREALLVSMAARVSISQPPARDEVTEWREALEYLARTTWSTFEAHPWLHTIVVSPTRLLDLMTEQQTESVLVALTRAGLSPRSASEALIATAAIPIGIAAVALPQTGSGRVQDVAIAQAVLQLGTGDGRGTEGPTPLADLFHARPIDADHGRSILNFTLQHFLDGVQATL